MALRTSLESTRFALVTALLAVSLTGCLHLQRKRYVREAALKVAAAPAEFEWITVPLRAFSVRDDDGKRKCGATVAQIEQWVAEANRIFSPARIRFQFNSALFEPVLSTLLNQISDGEGPEWEAQRERGEALAAGYPHDVVLLFRHGPDRSPSGVGLAGGAFRFVVMPSLQPGVFCGHANLNILPHELGHHFGLPHTFPQVFDSVWAAEEHFQGDLDRLDGDSLSDTPPDPFFRDEEFECDLEVNGVVLKGQAIHLPRHNLMSYLDSPRKALSPEQILQVRQGALRRTGQDFRKVLGGEVLPPIESRHVMPQVSPSGGWVQIQKMSGFWGAWASGEQMLWQGGHPGDSVSLRFSVPEDGVWELWGGFTLGPDFAQIQASVDEAPALLELEFYARTVRHSAPVRLGTSMLSAGEHRLRLGITGQHPRSTGSLVGFDYLLIKRAAPELAQKTVGF